MDCACHFGLQFCMHAWVGSYIIELFMNTALSGNCVISLVDSDDYEDTVEAEQLRTCVSLSEEDAHLVAPPVGIYAGDSGDIDDGELWDDAEEDINNDIGSTRCSDCEQLPENSRSGNDEDRHDEEGTNIIRSLSVIIALWSHRFNITRTALNALLKILGLFLYLLSTLSLPYVQASRHQCIDLTISFASMRIISIDMLSVLNVTPCILLNSVLKLVEGTISLEHARLLHFQNTPISHVTFLVGNVCFLKSN